MVTASRQQTNRVRASPGTCRVPLSEGGRRRAGALPLPSCIGWAWARLLGTQRREEIPPCLRAGGSVVWEVNAPWRGGWVGPMGLPGRLGVQAGEPQGMPELRPRAALTALPGIVVLQMQATVLFVLSGDFQRDP